MTNEQKMIQELIVENESLLNKIAFAQAYNKELLRKTENLSTTFAQLLDLCETYRNNLNYDEEQTKQMKYQFLEQSGIL